MIGRESETGTWSAVAAVGILAVLVSSVTWWINGSVLAAKVTRALLVLWLTAQGVELMVGLFLLSFSLLSVATMVWIALLYKGTSGWIQKTRVDTPGAPFGLPTQPEPEA